MGKYVIDGGSAFIGGVIGWRRYTMCHALDRSTNRESTAHHHLLILGNFDGRTVPQEFELAIRRPNLTGRSCPNLDVKD